MNEQIRWEPRWDLPVEDDRRHRHAHHGRPGPAANTMNAAYLEAMDAS